MALDAGDLHVKGGSVARGRLRGGVIDLHWIRAQDGLALGLIMVFVILGILSVQKVHITYDEPFHLDYGANILNLNSRRFDDIVAMPISALNAIPLKIAAYLPAGPPRDFLSSLLAARLMTIMFSAVVAYLVYHWSRMLHGRAGGLASLLLYVFDPNLIAHSQLATSDIYVAGFVLAASFWTWKFAVRRNIRNGLMCAGVLGLSLLAKYSMIMLLPLMLLALMLYDVPAQASELRERGAAAIGKYLGRLALYAATAVAAVLILVNAGFLFYRPFVALKDYQFTSAKFQSLQRTRILQDLRVPLPYPFLQGLDWLWTNEHAGWPVYLLGELRTSGGFPGYFLVASAFKTPIATQFALMGGLAAYVVNRGRRSTFLREDVFLIVPALGYAIYLNFFVNLDLGIRYSLMVFPLLYVWAGGLFSQWITFSRSQKTATWALLVYLVMSVLSYYPFYLAYFNEIVWDRKYAYKYLADSNLDWGQEMYYVQEFLKAHPGAVPNPERPTSGLVVVAANHLVGILVPREQDAWLRDNFALAGTIAQGFLVYDIPASDLDRLCQTRSICP